MLQNHTISILRFKKQTLSARNVAKNYPDMKRPLRERAWAGPWTSSTMHCENAEKIGPNSLNQTDSIFKKINTDTKKRSTRFTKNRKQDICQINEPQLSPK